MTDYSKGKLAVWLALQEHSNFRYNDLGACVRKIAELTTEPEKEINKSILEQFYFKVIFPSISDVLIMWVTVPVAIQILFSPGSTVEQQK